jgi:hypothetical protein
LGSIVYIGKESNALELVEAGLIHAIDEVQPRQPAPGSTAWYLVWRPALERVPLAELAVATGITERHVRYLQQGKRLPSPKVEEVLKAEAIRWAIKMCRAPDVEAMGRQLAERVLSVSHGRPGPRRQGSAARLRLAGVIPPNVPSHA